jgi:hypothetical protein
MRLFRLNGLTNIVMAGLVPAIHTLIAKPGSMDGRHEGGHDGWRVI